MPAPASSNGNTAISLVYATAPARNIADMIDPTYDSNKSAPIPATSPTLSPTLSAITPAFLGSSSGIPASILPTRSLPTSAALVNIPPPTLANKAIELAPKPNPVTKPMSCHTTYRTVTPRSPMPTTVSPITVPLEKATRNAGFSPLMAAAAVRTFALTATFIPTKPAIAEQTVPARYEIAVLGIVLPKVSQSIKTQSTTVTIATKGIRATYSRFRKAEEPSLIASPI